MNNPDSDVVVEPPKGARYEDFYSTPTYCPNCETHGAAYVRKGVRKKGLHISCNNCGCKVPL